MYIVWCEVDADNNLDYVLSHALLGLPNKHTRTRITSKEHLISVCGSYIFEESFQENVDRLLENGRKNKLPGN